MMWVCGLDWADPGQGQVADACECGNEPSGSIKMRGISRPKVGYFSNRPRITPKRVGTVLM